MRAPRPRVRRPSAPMIVALLALFVALDGPARAAKLIDGGDIRRGTVGSKQVKDRSIKPRDLARATIERLRAVPDGAVGDAGLADNSVSGRALAPGSVSTGHVADNSLGAVDLAPNAAGADEVAADAVGQSEIRNNGVGNSEIVDNAVTGGKIVDGSLSIRDIARQFGTLQWPIDPLPARACQVATVPVTGTDVAGDFIVISPVSDWPSALVYTVNGTSAGSSFKVQACNRSEVTVPEGRTTYTFNYAVLGT